MRLSLLVAFAIASCGPPRPVVTVPAPVVTTTDSPPPATEALEPPQPTLRLPTNFVPTSYAARLVVDPARPGFEGSIAITGNVAQRSTVIWLHGRKLAIAKAMAKGASEVELVATQKGEELLELRAKTPLDPGAWTLAIDYRGDYELVATTGAFKQTVAGSSYVYTQLESIYARRLFPCVDEPDNKVPWKLTLDVPKQLVAVSNMPATGEAPLPGDMKRVEFDTTPPLPTYLIAFGVGPFEIVDAGKTRTGAPVRVLTLAKRAAEGAWAAKTAVPIVSALEDWFAMPLPYPKLDLLAIPITVGFGAMENAGLITFTETLILQDPAKASKEREHVWVSVASHEVAHQWFGDFVTMKFWDDIWLNEGFANWMEAKVTGKIDPTYHDELGVLETRNSALGADGLVSARQIRQPIDSNDDIFTAFDGITYDKGASVLSMFEAYVGPVVFQQGVREYLKSRANGNATSKDFVSAIAAADAGKHPDIEGAFATFLDRPGAPEITATIACTGSGASLKAAVQLAQRRYVPPGAPTPPASGPWAIPLCVAYDNAGQRGEQCTLLSADSAALELPAKACPRWVMPNVEARSYLRVAYTTQQVTALRDEAWSKLSWNERRAIYFDVESATTNGKLPLQLALSFVPKLLAGNDRFTIEEALGLPNGVDALVSDELRPKYEYWLRTTFGPGAAATGFLAKPTDTLDIETTRGALIGAVGWTAREPALVAEAVKLSDRWRDLPQSIRRLVLAIAVDAKPDLFADIRKSVHGEPDRTKRLEMINALAGVRDPKLRASALDLVLDRELDIRETTTILFAGSTEANRTAGRAFFKAHDKEILDRLPKDGTAGQSSGFAYLFTETCRADERDAIVAYVTKTFAPHPGGARTVKQAIEGMDQCIARRAILEPEIKAWLQGVRLPKPKPQAQPPKAAPPKAKK